MAVNVALRPLRPDDGPALADLAAHSPDTGQITFSPRYQVDAYQALVALHEDVAGVVAEVPASGRVVGTGLITFSQRQFEGQVRPCALLHTLKVHPDYRRQGIAARLAAWRVEHAREQIGDEGVILANIQKNNIGSQATARTWCTQLVGRVTTGAVRMRTTPPAPAAGLTVRPARPAELDEIAAHLNTFYREYNFYQPQTGASLMAWLEQTPFTDPLHHYSVITDTTGRPLAGAAISEWARLTTLHVERMPWAMGLVNKLVKLVPADGVLRQIYVDNLWYAPGHLGAARQLWDTIRWDWRERGSVVLFGFDPRGPLAAVFRLPAWMPKGTGMLAVRGPVPLREDRLIYPYF